MFEYRVLPNCPAADDSPEDASYAKGWVGFTVSLAAVDDLTQEHIHEPIGSVITHVIYVYKNLFPTIYGLVHMHSGYYMRDVLKSIFRERQKM